MCVKASLQRNVRRSIRDFLQSRSIAGVVAIKYETLVTTKSTSIWYGFKGVFRKMGRESRLNNASNQTPETRSGSLVAVLSKRHDRGNPGVVEGLNSGE